MATRKTTSKRPRLPQDQLKQQILEAFSAKAKREGIRNVMMAELASELRMSPSTLYKLYPSKEALTLACVDRWADELGAVEAAKPHPGAQRDGFEGFMHWVDAWAEINGHISPAFARDLRSDYPTAWKRFQSVIHERQERGAELLRPVLKPDIDERVAFAILKMLLDEVLRPEFADRLRISRHDAIRSAMTIWAAGAVDRRGKLRAIAGTAGGDTNGKRGSGRAVRRQR
jgi:AcrR family transcriptional regulator